MGKSRSRIPRLRLHKPSGRAVVTLNGRDHYCGPGGSEEAEKKYNRVIAEWLANGRKPMRAQGHHAGLSMAELIAQYWAFVQGHYVKHGKPTSEQGAIKAAVRPVLELYGDVDVREFGPQALVTCRTAMIEKGWTRYTVNKHVGRVRRMVAWGTERELVPGSVYHGLLAVKGLQRGRTAARESKGVGTVSIEHVDAVLPHVSPQVSAMIRLQLLNGMRPGEVVLMRPCDIEDDGCADWLYRPHRHKTEHHGHDRVVPLGPGAQRILKPFLADRAPEAYLFDPREAEAIRKARRRLARKSKVTPSQAARRGRRKPRRNPREHYTRDSYRRAVQRACERAGIPKWSPHQLRHNAATELEAEYDLETAGGLGPKLASGDPGLRRAGSEQGA